MLRIIVCINTFASAWGFTIAGNASPDRARVRVYVPLSAKLSWLRNKSAFSWHQTRRLMDRVLVMKIKFVEEEADIFQPLFLSVNEITPGAF